jgi:hypothetical protein
MLRDDGTAALAAPNTLVLRIATQSYPMQALVGSCETNKPLPSADKTQDAARRGTVGLTRAFLTA